MGWPPLSYKPFDKLRMNTVTGLAARCLYNRSS